MAIQISYCSVKCQCWIGWKIIRNISLYPLSNIHSTFFALNPDEIACCGKTQLRRLLVQEENLYYLGPGKVFNRKKLCLIVLGGSSLIPVLPATTIRQFGGESKYKTWLAHFFRTFPLPFYSIRYFQIEMIAAVFSFAPKASLLLSLRHQLMLCFYVIAYFAPIRLFVRRGKRNLFLYNNIFLILDTFITTFDSSHCAHVPNIHCSDEINQFN